MKLKFMLEPWSRSRAKVTAPALAPAKNPGSGQLRLRLLVSLASSNVHYFKINGFASGFKILVIHRAIQLSHYSKLLSRQIIQ